MFILIGTNDIKKNIEVNRYIENIKKIIQLITAEKRWIKKKIYLINIPNIYLFPENKYFTQEQIKKINIYNLKLKEFFGIDKIIDIYQINIKPDNYQDDGIHFNKVGTNNLFNEILKKIE
ncbi:MAG TPA: SGNH/GDSL hydrolase family protein [bacterium]|nr:SGNH/GDSL hydrolase family protein [bacterium]